jgi:hypothetical protein
MQKGRLLALPAIALLAVAACSSTPSEIGGANEPAAAAAVGVTPEVLTGTWTGDWGPTPQHRNNVSLQLNWDGANLTGSINPGPSAIQLSKASFDSGAAAIMMEADAKGHDGAMVHYRIEGKVGADNTMTGTWTHEKQQGDYKISKSEIANPS